jgi:sortase A
MRRKRYLPVALGLAFVIAAGLLAWKNARRTSAPPIVKPPVATENVPPPPIVPAPPSFRPGERIGEIEIPRLKVAVPVYEGDDAAILKRGAGHVPGTALPGAPGNICIAAHRDKFFRELRFIKPNDEIVLATSSGPMRFVVSSTSIVKPSETKVLLPAPHRDLTLVTCYPFFYVGSAPKRFIVHASREPAYNPS